MTATQETTVRDVCAVLLRHKRKVFAVVALSLVGGLLFLLFAPREYRSEGKFYLRLGRDNTTLDATTTMGRDPVVAVPQSREDELISAVEILKSRVIAEHVVQAIGPEIILGHKSLPIASESGIASTAIVEDSVLDHLINGVNGLLKQVGLRDQLSPEEGAILRFGSSLGISRKRDSNVIEIAYDSPSPRLSQAVVSKLMDLFLEHRISLNRSREAHSFLTIQKDRLQSELVQAEQKYHDLKDETGLVAPTEQRQSLVTQIARLEDDLRQTQATLAGVDSEITALQKKLAELPKEQITSRTTGVGNEGTDGIRQQVYALEMQQLEMSAKFTDSHPRLQSIRQQLAAAKKVLKEEEPTRSQVTTGVNRGHEETQINLLRLQPQQASLQSKAVALKGQLTQARVELATLNANELRVSRAERSLQLHEADYRKYVAALEQARIDEALGNEKISNIRIAQSASFETRPVNPRKTLVLAGTLVLAIAGSFLVAFGAESLNRSFHTAADVERRLGLPVLTTVSSLGARSALQSV